MVEINLLAKKSQQKKQHQKMVTNYLLVPIIMGLIIMICTHFYYAPSITAKQSEINNIQTQITAVSAKIINPDALQNDQNIVKSAINSLLKVKYQQYIGVNIFKLMTLLTPKDIYLMTILNQNGNVALLGQTYSKKAVTVFLNDLSKIPFITTPELGEITTNKDTNLNSFKILFSIKQPLEFYDIPKENKK